MATNVIVTQRNNESAERLVRRFIKKCKKERIIEEVRDRMSYRPPSVKRREKRKRARRALQREQRREQRTVRKHLGERD